MKSPFAWWLVLALPGLAGCEYNQYELELRPNGSVIERQLTCWRIRDKGNNEYELTKFSPEELSEIAKHYPERLTTPAAAKHGFRGKFENTMPGDIGGAGSYTYLTSPLGTTASYVERFRGNDDVDTQFYDKRQVGDRMTDLLLGWLETEVGQDPIFPAVRRLVHQDVRQDFRNVGLYCWLGRSLAVNDEVETSSKTNPETWTSASEIHARVRQYLVERGYLLPHETIAGLQAEVESGGGQGHVVIQRVMARKLGLTKTDEVQRALGFLSNPEEVQASILKYLESTPEFQRRLKQWEAEKRTNPSASSRPNANEILTELTLSLLELEIGNRADKLHLTLKVPVPPYQTNGVWDSASGHIMWNKSLRKDAGLPALCVASWDEPDTKFQSAHFDRVVLTGKELLNYNVWRRAITPTHGTQWDDFLAGLKPGKDLSDTLAAFEFSGESKTKGEKAAIQGRDLIVEALKKGE
jgi:hypothetical protein